MNKKKEEEQTNDSVFDNVPSPQVIPIQNKPGPKPKLKEEKKEEEFTELKIEKTKSEIVEQTPTITPQEPINQKVYYLYMGDTEAEFYTFVDPEIKDGMVYIKNVIRKGVVKEVVLETEIVIPYKLEGTTSNIKFPIIDSDGIILKCFSVDSIDLGWVKKTKAGAEEDFKAAKLKIYDNIIPQLYQNVKQGRRSYNQENLMDL